MVFLFLIFWGNSILFSKMAVPICIPTNSVGRILFLHIPTTYYFLSFCHLTDIGWCLIVVFICIFLMTSDVEHFSCVCWPYVCLLCKNVYSGPLPIFKLEWGKVVCFWCWAVCVLYVFWMLTPYWLCHLQISSPVQYVARFVLSKVSLAVQTFLTFM